MKCTHISRLGEICQRNAQHTGHHAAFDVRDAAEGTYAKARMWGPDGLPINQQFEGIEHFAQRKD